MFLYIVSSNVNNSWLVANNIIFINIRPVIYRSVIYNSFLLFSAVIIKITIIVVRCRNLGKKFHALDFFFSFENK